MKAKYKKMKYIVIARIKRLFEANEATKDLIAYINEHFKKNSTDRGDFQELNRLFLSKIADKKAQIQKAYAFHGQMLLLASLKGQKQAIECIQTLTSEYTELYATYRKFIKQFPALRCPLGYLKEATKPSDSYIDEANAFFSSVTK